MKAIPALVTAGDRRASKAVYGESKVFLELAGRPLVVHIVLELQSVPEVSEVWVVGDAERLRRECERDEVRDQLSKPLHIVEQFRNLYENGWETFRRLLPGADENGRDPSGPEDEFPVLYLSGDIPFATAQEISQFIRRGIEVDCDFAFGLVTEQSMEGFYPTDERPSHAAQTPTPIGSGSVATGKPGIHMAYFNVVEGRFRTSNLHLVKPARIVNRFYVEEMFEHRYQQQFGNIVGLAARLVRKEEGGFPILYYYGLIHMAGLADRWGWRRIADAIRAWIPLDQIAAACSALLRADFQFVVTDIGGCALDIDNQHDFDIATIRYEDWKHQQQERANERIAALPETTVEPAE